MDDKKRILKLLEMPKTEQETASKSSKSFAHPHQTNPICKNMVKFANENIGKFSIKDLLR